MPVLFGGYLWGVMAVEEFNKNDARVLCSGLVCMCVSMCVCDSHSLAYFPQSVRKTKAKNYFA